MPAELSTTTHDIKPLAEIFAKLAERGRKLREAQEQTGISGEPLAGETLIEAGAPSNSEDEVGTQSALDLPHWRRAGESKPLEHWGLNNDQ